MPSHPPQVPSPSPALSTPPVSLPVRAGVPSPAPRGRRSITALGVGFALLVTGAALAHRTTKPEKPIATEEPAVPAPPRAKAASRGAEEARDTRTQAMSALGRAIFFDPSLSEPPGTSCASCHDPAHGYAGNHGSHAGVPLGSRPGHLARRSTPSVLYLKFVKRFHWHWEEDMPLPDAVGGFFWDGRVDTLAEVTRQPLLNPDEMGNLDAEQVAIKLSRAGYVDDLRALFPDAEGAPERALDAAGRAVEAFLTSDAMSPFSSKYDDYIRGRSQLTSLEARGLELFKDATKGNCDACHKLNDASSDPRRSLFSDYGFEAVGVPRNRRLPTNADPRSFDLGLCEGPDPKKLRDDARLCSTFRTPSLRNVATRTSFMHNGFFSSLREVVSFYATRDTDPDRWYPKGNAFDDVPPAYRVQINVASVPYTRKRGQAPLLDARDIDAIVAFLETLTDTVTP